MPEHLIENRDDPRLAPYRQLKDTNHTRWFERFVAEGEKLTLRLLASTCDVESVLVDRTHWERLQPHLRPDLDVLIVADRLVPEIVGFNFHRGVLACGRRPQNVSLDDLAGKPRHVRRLVVLPDVQDPENLGTIIRTSAAFGIDGVLLGRDCADPFSRRVLRTSMGAVWRVPLRKSPELLADLDRLRGEFAIELVATLLGPSARPLADFQPPLRWALLLGNEGHGLASGCLAACRHHLTLPMQPGTDSLNVSIAAGIFLYHLTQ